MGNTANIIAQRNRKKLLDFLASQDDADIKTLFEVASIPGAVKKLDKKKDFLKKFL